MRNNCNLTIYPVKVPMNASLTVKTYDEKFPDDAYLIINNEGKIIRKGAISRNILEFKLSMVGLATGVYSFTMGHVQEQFTIL